MHGPEHWFGLIRAWIIIAVFVYLVWSLLDVIRDQAISAVRRLSQRR